MSTRLFLAAALAAAVVLPMAPAVEGAATDTQAEIAGYRLPVSSGWRIVDLRSAPASCVTTERSTIYLGSAGDQGHCAKPERYGAPTLQVEPSRTGQSRTERAHRT